jgi:hypothetical protein
MRLLIAIFLLLAILCVCVAHHDTNVLATALRAAQAALSVMLGLIFFALLARPWLARHNLYPELLVAIPKPPPPPGPLAPVVLTC